MPKYWISVRSVRGDEFTSDPDIVTPRYLKVPDGEVPTPAHRITRTQWVKEIIDDLPIKDGVKVGDLLILIHGFNVSVASSDSGHRLVQAGIDAQNFPCRVISFDWPSQGTPFAYLPDRDLAKATAVALVDAGIRVLRAAMRPDCQTSIHVLAHSMGAFLVREALDHSEDDAAHSAWSLSQLVFAEGDISSQSLAAGNPESAAIYRHCYRYTNYFNHYDEALQISNAKRIGLAPRVGRVGLPIDAPAKAVDVDCSDHYIRVHGGADNQLAELHSWFFNDPFFYEDLAITLKGAIDRDVIPTRDHSGPVAKLR